MNKTPQFDQQAEPVLKLKLKKGIYQYWKLYLKVGKLRSSMKQ